jgi:uncharacterized protein YcbK (DUF882 family)
MDAIMTEKTIYTFDSDENETISSRRKFIKNMAYGSLLAFSGVANAKSSTTHPSNTQHNSKHTGRTHTVLDRHVSAHKMHTHQVSDRHHSVHNNQVHTASSQHTPPPRIIDRHSLSHKALAFKNPHTGDHLQLTYYENGHYVNGALGEISHLCRDHFTGDSYPVDPALLDQMYDLKQTLGINKPFHLVCGYRSPFTNAMLRSQSHAVAKNSLHMQGKAVDIRIEGVDTRVIRDAALAMQRGGVGYYHRDNFIHLDSGDIRSWAS